MKTLLIRKLRLPLLTCMAFLFSTLACNKDHSMQDDKQHGSGAQTSVHVFLTDDPSPVFDDIFLDIQKVEIKAEDHDQAEHEREHQGESDDNDRHGDTNGGWINLSIRPGVYDILKFRNGLDTLLATGNFPSINTIRKIRLTLGSNNSVVLNGTAIPLFTSDNGAIIVVKVDDDFGATSTGQLEFSLDFDGGRSIRVHGDHLELDLQVKPFRHEKTGSIEGRVLPAGANPIVMAIVGSDTTTAKPEREGEYKIVGLNDGNYSVLFHATTGSFKDTLIQNVSVRRQEDTHLPAITLHP